MLAGDLNIGDRIPTEQFGDLIVDARPYLSASGGEPHFDEVEVDVTAADPRLFTRSDVDVLPAETGARTFMWLGLTPLRYRLYFHPTCQVRTVAEDTLKALLHTMYSGNPDSVERALAYLAALDHADGDAIASWLTTVCPECQQPAGDTDHVIVHGFVVIGCEGLHIINPNAIGLDNPTWQDWRNI